MTRAKKNRGKNRSGIIVSAVLLSAASVLLLAARMLDGFADLYSSNIYPLLVNTIGRLSGVLPFSLAEVLVLLFPIIIIADALLNRRHIGIFFRRLLILLSFLFFLYSANCGVNYYKEPFVDPQAWSYSSFTPDQLADFCEYSAGMLRQSYAETEGTSFTYPDNTSLTSDAVSAMEKLGKEYNSLSGYYPKPKCITFLSGFFSSMGVSGIYSPFTIEANINSAMPGMEKPFTACHELSHLKGYMNEGEANYIGWLACVGSDDPAFRRSGWLIAWSHAGNALYRTDPDRYMKVAAMLPEDALRELKENHDYWESHETKASDVQDKVNDAYLKSNGQEEGIAAYGNLTTFMLIWYFSEDHFD